MGRRGAAVLVYEFIQEHNRLKIRSNPETSVISSSMCRTEDREVNGRLHINNSITFSHAKLTKLS